MQKDEGDTCCSIPHCTGPAANTYIPIPVYGQYQSKGNVAQPPPNNQRFTGPAGNFGAHGGVATVLQTGTTVPPPTVGNFSQGGIGECVHIPDSPYGLHKATLNYECIYIYIYLSVYLSIYLSP